MATFLALSCSGIFIVPKTATALCWRELLGFDGHVGHSTRGGHRVLVWFVDYREVPGRHGDQNVVEHLLISEVRAFVVEDYRICGETVFKLVLNNISVTRNFLFN